MSRVRRRPGGARPGVVTAADAPRVAHFVARFCDDATAQDPRLQMVCEEYVLPKQLDGPGGTDRAHPRGPP